VDRDAEVTGHRRCRIEPRLCVDLNALRSQERVGAEGTNEQIQRSTQRFDRLVNEPASAPPGP
jgi:hypothetical protein